MVLDVRKMSVAEFDEWVHHPENVDHDYEYIRGEIVDVVSNSKSSNLGSILGGYIAIHVHTNDLGHTTGADGGYRVEGERYIPDVGFVSKARMPVLEDVSYLSIPPDLAVEVISPTDSQRLLTVKIANYLAADTMVWVVYPDEKAVEIYEQSRAVVRLTENDELDGGDLLPNFKLSLQQLFP